MKTTIDIPETALEDAIRFSHAKTKREAILAALEDFNRRKRMAALGRHLGTCRNLITANELNRLRDKG